MSTATKKREKRVFKDSREAAHVWAQQRQAYGCNPSRNIYFERETIFSYGGHFPIARFTGRKIDGREVVLFTMRTYSVTTSGHISDVRQALHGLDVLIINVQDVSPYSLDANKRENLESLWNGLRELAAKHVKARENDYRREMGAALRNIDAYTKFTKIGRTKALAALMAAIAGNWWHSLANLSPEQATDIDDTKAARRETREIREGAKRAIDSANDAAREALYCELQPIAVAAWRAGEDRIAIPQELIEKYSESLPNLSNVGNVSCLNYVGYSYNAPTLLRISGDEIETSRGARVPIRHAKLAWQALKRREVPAERIGHYKATAIESDCLVIGCHRIPLVEIDRIAGELGLAS